jgi:hypothetical protein
VNLYLTELGQETLGRVPKPAQGILQHALVSLPEDTLRSIVRDLDILISQMNIKDASDGLEPIDIVKPLEISEPGETHHGTTTPNDNRA